MDVRQRRHVVVRVRARVEKGPVAVRLAFQYERTAGRLRYDIARRDVAVLRQQNERYQDADYRAFSERVKVSR